MGTSAARVVFFELNKDSCGSVQANFQSNYALFGGINGKNQQFCAALPLQLHHSKDTRTVGSGKGGFRSEGMDTNNPVLVPCAWLPALLGLPAAPQPPGCPQCPPQGPAW